VYIRSRRPHHPALRCDGCVNQFENVTEHECWTLEHLDKDVYYVSYNTLHLYASPNGKLFFSHHASNCKWTIESTRKGYVSIKSRYGKYLCCDEGFRTIANREHCELWEQWAITDIAKYVYQSTLL